MGKKRRDIFLSKRADSCLSSPSSSSPVKSADSDITEERPRKIPGFYYDQEARKYYKIEAHGKHSLDFIQKREASVLAQKKSLELKKHSIAYASPLRGLLASSLGIKQPNIWQGLVACWRPKKLYTLDAPITAFSMNRARNGVFAGSSNGKLLYSSLGQTSELAQFESPLTSVHSRFINASDVVITTHLGHETKGGMLKIYSVQDHAHGPCSQELYSFSARKPIPIWCSAVTESCSAIAIGSFGTAHVLNGWTQGNESVICQVLSMPVRTDVLSQTFDHSNLLNGCRNGMVYSYDLRSYSAMRPASRMGPSDQFCIYHADPVTCIETWDEKVATGSMDGTFHLWDKRNLTCPLFSFSDGNNRLDASRREFVIVGKSVLMTFASSASGSYLRSWSTLDGSPTSFKETPSSGLASMYFDNESLYTCSNSTVSHWTL